MLPDLQFFEAELVQMRDIFASICREADVTRPTNNINEMRISRSALKAWIQDYLVDGCVLPGSPYPLHLS